MTMIARVADGLPLAASIQEDEQVSNILKIRPYYGPLLFWRQYPWLIKYDRAYLCFLMRVSDGKEHSGLSAAGQTTI